MKILEIKTLVLPEVKIIEFERFADERGYFTETYRAEDLAALDFLKGIKFQQQNESFSKANVMRGLHFQWSPPMGKMVRTVFGHMVDMVMDIRQGSPNFGKIILYNMPSHPDQNRSQWIWVPPGFAHGNFFTEPTLIQYFCTEAYKPESEAGISPLSADLNWSLCDLELNELFTQLKARATISEKDKNNMSLSQWKQDSRSENFIYGRE